MRKNIFQKTAGVVFTAPTKFAAMRLVGFEPVTSPSRVPSLTTALHYHMCLYTILVPQIL
jgi:hypothetical protein